MEDITSPTQAQEPIPPTMRAFAIEDFGQTGSFHQLPVPSIEADQVLVRVRAVGINPVDWKIAQGGRYKDRMATRSWPLILGLDAAGVVMRVGDEVSRFRAGDEVYGVFSLVPTTLVLLGLSQAPAHSGTKLSLGSLLGPALVNAIKTPFVWAPLLAIALVLIGVSVRPCSTPRSTSSARLPLAWRCLSRPSPSLPANCLVNLSPTGEQGFSFFPCCMLCLMFSRPPFER